MTGPVYHQLAADWQRATTAPKENTTVTQTDPAAQPSAVSLAPAEQAIREHASSAWMHLRQILDEHLQPVTRITETIESSPLVQVSLQLAGKLSPEAEEIVVDVVRAMARKLVATEPTAPA